MLPRSREEEQYRGDYIRMMERTSRSHQPARSLNSEKLSASVSRLKYSMKNGLFSGGPAWQPFAAIGLRPAIDRFDIPPA